MRREWKRGSLRVDIMGEEERKRSCCVTRLETLDDMSMLIKVMGYDCKGRLFGRQHYGAIYIYISSYRECT